MSNSNREPISYRTDAPANSRGIFAILPDEFIATDRMDQALQYDIFVRQEYGRALEVFSECREQISQGGSQSSPDTSTSSAPVQTTTVSPPPFPRTILDIGSYKGDFALWCFLEAERLWAALPRITLVEPFPEHLDMARSKLAKYSEYCEFLPFAVMPHSGIIPSVATLYQNERLPMQSSFQIGNALNVEWAPIELPAIDPSELFARFDSIDLVKVDIEGAEYAFFDAICQSEQIKKARVIAGEYHRISTEADEERLPRQLRASGFSVEHSPGPYGQVTGNFFASI